MNILKKIVLHTINAVRFRKVPGAKNRKILANAKLHMKIEIEKGGSIELSGKCPVCREDCQFTVRSNGKLSIGTGAFFNKNCFIACRESISIGDDCLFGPNVCIFDHDHKFDVSGVSRTEFKTKPVEIGDHVWIGANVTILKGAKIGNHVVIGAGAVVTGEIPDNTIYVQKREPVCIPLEDRR